MKNATLLLVFLVGIGTGVILAAMANYQSPQVGPMSFGSPTVHWNPPVVHAGEPLTREQLNATADEPGQLIYRPRLGTVLPKGRATLQVTYLPDHRPNFSSSMDMNIEVQ